MYSLISLYENILSNRSELFVFFSLALGNRILISGIV